MLDTISFANLFGFLALLFYIVTLLPTILRVVFPATKSTGIPKRLLKYRRHIGVLAFCFALIHGGLLLGKRNIDFFDPETYWVYFLGGATFIIFTLLAITSNDWSVKIMKKNWKRLHSLTYLAIFLLTAHVYDKMSGHWSYLTPLGIAGMTGTAVFFLMRKWIEKQNKSSKTKAKPALNALKC